METITEGQPDFKTFEREIFELMCRIACELIRMYLELRDLSILGMRDTKEYRYIDKRQTTIKTVMGEVTFSRVYYKKASGGYVFLLDEVMGIDCGCGLVSENLAEQIVAECMDKSFRKAADSVTSNTMQSISAMGVWGIVQKYSETVEQQVMRLKELDAGGSTGHLGDFSTPVVFNEFDDVWISRQPEERQKRGEPGTEAPEKPKKKLGKKPMHVGIAYSGWEQAKDGRYSTVNKIAYAMFGNVSGFTSNFNALLRQHFDMDGVERIVTNGDGESWIRTEAENNDSLLQLDPFHRSEAITRSVSDKSGRKLLYDAISEKNVVKTLEIIRDLAAEAQDEKSQDKLVKLFDYFYNNRDIMLTWQERGIELPTPPEGIAYRELGVQESSNCSLLTQRMKGRRGSWSETGGNNMGMLLCFRSTIGLDAILGTLPEPPPAEAWRAPLSAAKTPQYDGKGYGADWLHAEMPFEHTFRTNGRESIRNMVRMRPISQLAFK